MLRFEVMLIQGFVLYLLDSAEKVRPHNSNSTGKYDGVKPGTEGVEYRLYFAPKVGCNMKSYHKTMSIILTK